MELFQPSIIFFDALQLIIIGPEDSTWLSVHFFIHLLSLCTRGGERLVHGPAKDQEVIGPGPAKALGASELNV